MMDLSLESTNFEAIHSIFENLNDRFTLSEELRLRKDGEIAWLVFGAPSQGQGWKIHLSCRSDEFNSLFKIATTYLIERKVSFKIAASQDIAQKINNGECGAQQVGKIATIYPDNDKEASSTGMDLARILESISGPVIDNEIRLGENSPVYSRYGAFIKQTRKSKLGINVEVIMDSTGNWQPDIRGIESYKDLGFTPPFSGNNFQPVEVSEVFNHRYVRIGLLHEGKHSKVYFSVDTNDGSHCITKCVKHHSGLDARGRDASMRLENDHNILQILAPLNIAPTPLFFSSDKNFASLIMEYIDGTMLLDRCRGNKFLTGALSEKQRLDIAMNLVSAVRKIHSKDIVIGDFTPANILVDPKNNVKLIDFEFSQLLGNENFMEFGTPGYTSPDILSGNALPSKKHDLFSLGAILYFVFSGVDLSSIPNSHAVLSNLIDLPGEIGSIVENLVTENLKDEDADSHLDDLEGALRRYQTTIDHQDFAEIRDPKNLSVLLQSSDDDALSDWLKRSGENLLSLREQNSDPHNSWVSSHTTTRGESYRDFSIGDAGIAYALLRIGIATNDVKFIEAAMDAADRLWNSQDLAFGNSGLLVGESGVGYLYLCIGWLTGEQDWYDRALYLANNLDSIEGASPDIYHGNSGRGLFHTWLFQETGSSAHKDIALNIFNYLIKTVQNTPFGPLWKIPEGYLDLSDHQFFGMAHGSAGIGLFLIEMAKNLGFEPAADLAESIGNGLIQAEKRSEVWKASNWPDSPGGPARGGIWCHGSAGIGLFLTQLYLLNKQAHFLDAARRALELSVLDLPYVGATQCHGLAGILESLLTINEVDSDVNWATAITNVKYRLRHYFSKEFENGPMICSELPSNFTPEFMVGSSGAASALARSISKGRLGYFLSNPRDGFKPADLTSLPRQT